MRMEIGNWDSLGEDARAVRYDVFVLEQNIPVDLEWDEMDAVSLHAVAYDDAGHPVGTGRLLPDGHIGRLAVKKAARRSGVGSRLLQVLMQQARERGDRGVVLNAQLSAATFYLRFGFVVEGDEFEEAGIPHICMRHIFR